MTQYGTLEQVADDGIGPTATLGPIDIVLKTYLFNVAYSK